MISIRISIENLLLIFNSIAVNKKEKKKKSYRIENGAFHVFRRKPAESIAHDNHIGQRVEVQSVVIWPIDGAHLTG